jgi:hypothetical protein
MQALRTSLWAVAVSASGMIALSGCGKSGAASTTISYHEVGICKSYDIPTGTAKAQTDEGYAIFKIESVDNTKNGSLFNFSPDRLYVDQSNAEQRMKAVDYWNRRFVSADPRFPQSMNVKGVAPEPVAAGQKLETQGFILVSVGTDNPTGGPEADRYNLVLAYDTGTSENQKSVNEGILMVKTNPADASYPVVESCKELALK